MRVYKNNILKRATEKLDLLNYMMHLSDQVQPSSAKTK